MNARKYRRAGRFMLGQMRKFIAADRSDEYRECHRSRAVGLLCAPPPSSSPFRGELYRRRCTPQPAGVDLRSAMFSSEGRGGELLIIKINLSRSFVVMQLRGEEKRSNKSLRSERYKFSLLLLPDFAKLSTRIYRERWNILSWRVFIELIM